MLLKKLKRVRIELVLIAAMFFSTTVLAQQNEIVWYFSSKEKSEIPIIEDVLKKLKKKKLDESFFANAIFLNSLQSNEEEEFEIRKQLDRFAEFGFFAIDKSSPANDTLLQNLLGFNYFLRIELQTNSSFKEKEFTFSLYKAIPGSALGSNEVELAEIDKESLLTEHAKITPGTSSEQILIQLGNAIKRLIPEVNEPPIVKISINGLETSIYHNTLGRTIELSGANSEDEDTDRQSFNYNWRQISLDGSLNVPIRKLIPLERNKEKAIYMLPDTGIYKIGLIVNDGIEDSVEDTLTIINFNPPKIVLSKNALRNKRKISFFQFLGKKNRSKKIDDQVSVKIESEIPLNYELNYFEIRGSAYPRIEIDKTKFANNVYHTNFKGKLKYRDAYQFGFYGKSEDINTDTTYYSLRHSKFVFGRISIGVEPLIGPAIFCVESLHYKIWAVVPTSMMGGIYILHDRGVSLLFESGVLIFWNDDIADRLAGGYGLGKASLKVTTDLPSLAPYFALQVIGGIVTNEAGVRVNRRHYGLLFGTSLFKNKLDIDLLNIYYNPGNDCLTLSGGIRFNLY